MLILSVVRSMGLWGSLQMNFWLSYIINMISTNANEYNKTTRVYTCAL
jgi:hypothetical protein